MQDNCCRSSDWVLCSSIFCSCVLTAHLGGSAGQIPEVHFRQPNLRNWVSEAPLQSYFPGLLPTTQVSHLNFAFWPEHCSLFRYKIIIMDIINAILGVNILLHRERRQCVIQHCLIIKHFTAKSVSKFILIA